MSIFFKRSLLEFIFEIHFHNFNKKNVYFLFFIFIFNFFYKLQFTRTISL